LEVLVGRLVAYQGEHDYSDIEARAEVNRADVAGGNSIKMFDLFFCAITSTSAERTLPVISCLRSTHRKAWPRAPHTIKKNEVTQDSFWK
jgi:hypothetical protein